MNQAIDKPLFTEVFEHAAEFILDEHSVLVHGGSTEERHDWLSDQPSSQLAGIHNADATSFAANFRGESASFSLRSSKQIGSFWKLIGAKSARVILDLTTLPHSVWALLVRSGLSEELNLDVCYTEPRDYLQHPAPPLEGEIFDLSERIEGIRPLPGFASLHDEMEDNFLLIALLGFEGTRFAHMVESIQPTGDRIIPVIGVPGFQPEFVFHAFLGNKPALLSTSCFTKMMYAPANCPFSLCYLLENIAIHHPEVLLKIALLGTKPHALGAFLFERRSKRQVEFVYDHPVRKPKRTSGIARLMLYRVSSFLNSGYLKIC